MSKSTLEKSKQLGMNFSTASHRLRKMVMFSLIQHIGFDICYRCGERIESYKDLSLDHVEDWMYSENPRELFFDVKNISFSHIGCNAKASSTNNLKTKKAISDAEERIKSGIKRCCRCSKDKSIECFNIDNSKTDKLQPHCKDCQKDKMKQYRLTKINTVSKI